MPVEADSPLQADSVVMEDHCSAEAGLDEMFQFPAEPVPFVEVCQIHVSVQHMKIHNLNYAKYTNYTKYAATMHNVCSDVDLPDLSDSPPIVGRYQSVYDSQMMTIRREDGETVLTEDL